jgi:hypothetical protein
MTANMRSSGMPPASPSTLTIEHRLSAPSVAPKPAPGRFAPPVGRQQVAAPAWSIDFVLIKKTVIDHRCTTATPPTRTGDIVPQKNL